MSCPFVIFDIQTFVMGYTSLHNGNYNKNGSQNLGSGISDTHNSTIAYLNRKC